MKKYYKHQNNKLTTQNDVTTPCQGQMQIRTNTAVVCGPSILMSVRQGTETQRFRITPPKRFKKNNRLNK